MPFASSGSASLAFDVRGDGPAVLLLHAGVTDRRSWASLLAALGGSFRTIAYDRRGFGTTRYEGEPHSQLADALAVLDAAGTDRAVVVGASNGGKHAIDLALHHPERVVGLALIGAGVRGAPEVPDGTLPPAAQELIAAYEAAEARGDLEALNRLEAHFWLDGQIAPEGRVTGPARALFVDMNGIALRAPDPGEEHDPGPAWDRLGEISVPALVLCGDLDVVCLPTSAHLGSHLPGARHEVLEGTAHLPHLEGHPRCLDAIVELAASV